MAIVVAVTVTLGSATLSQIIRITDVTGRTKTLTVVTGSFRSTLNFLAQVLTSASVTTEARGTENPVVTITIFAVSADASLYLRTHNEGISGVTFLAPTVVASDGVDTNSALSTNTIAAAFVYIVTTNEGISGETRKTNTLDVVIGLFAFGVLSTGR